MPPRDYSLRLSPQEPELDQDWAPTSSMEASTVEDKRIVPARKQHRPSLLRRLSGMSGTAPGPDPLRRGTGQKEIRAIFNSGHGAQHPADLESRQMQPHHILALALGHTDLVTITVLICKAGLAPGMTSQDCPEGHRPERAADVSVVVSITRLTIQGDFDERRFTTLPILFSINT